MAHLSSILYAFKNIILPVIYFYCILQKYWLLVHDRLQNQTTTKRDRSFIDCLRSTALKQPILHSLLLPLFPLCFLECLALALPLTLTSKMQVLSVVSLGLLSCVTSHGQLTDSASPQETANSEIFMANLESFLSSASDSFILLPAAHLYNTVPLVPWLVNSYLLITYHMPAVRFFFPRSYDYSSKIEGQGLL